MRRSSSLHSAAAAGYALLACVLTWPLCLHLTSALLGEPSGDTGVYVWNLWIFSHELIDHQRLPFSTDHIFAALGGADFSLHNYTPIANLLALPLLPIVGVVGTYNLLVLGFIVLTAFGVYLLAHRLGLRPAMAWCAGALFIAAPSFTAKETAHFSLVIAPALPLFLWALVGALETRRVRDGVLIGVFTALASYSDAYYGVYCVMMGLLLVALTFTRVDWNGPPTRAWITRVLNGIIVIVGGAVIWRIVSGSTLLALGPLRIGLQTLYTPVLVVSLAIALRLWCRWRPTPRVLPIADLRGLIRTGLIAVAVCLVLLTPELAAITINYINDRLPETDVFWRSSPRGLDLLSYFVPNPNHPLFGDVTRSWFAPARDDAFPEFVGSFSWIAFIVIAAAAWMRTLPAIWVAFTGCFVWLSFGPFLNVAGINTLVPGPWTFLRFAPVIGMVRSPTRFALLAALGLSLLFAFALEALSQRIDDRRRWMAAVVLVAALALELTPAPRPLVSAAVPEVFARVAVRGEGDERGRLLPLPTGIRDGTSSVGNFNPADEYFQTQHGRPLIGGYLSRVPRQLVEASQQIPMMRALFTLSEGADLSSESAHDAHRSGHEFLAQSCVRFVVVDKHRASDRLVAFATEALNLSVQYEDSGYRLLAPIDPPNCMN